MVYHLWFPGVGAFGLAVDLFFVLSGYLITTIILDNAHTEGFLFSFYARRSLRIWPVYYLTLAAVVLINGFLPSPGNLGDLPFYLTYTQEAAQGWLGREPTFPLAFRHTWSLAIEEQFYIVWPVMIRIVGPPGCPRAGPGDGRRGRGGAGLGHEQLHPGHSLRRAGTRRAARVPDRRASLRRLAVFRRPGPIHGTLAGRARRGPGLAGVHAADQCALAGAAPAGTAESLKMLGGNLVLLAIVGGIVLHSGRPGLGWLRNPWLVYLGTISYGIYLYHHIIFRLWDDFAVHMDGPRAWPWTCSSLAVSLALAMLSWHLVERPILALKGWFGYQPAAPTALRRGPSPDERPRQRQGGVIHGRAGSRVRDRRGPPGVFPVPRLHAGLRSLRAGVDVPPRVRPGVRDPGPVLPRLGPGDPGQGPGDGCQFPGTVGDRLVPGGLPVGAGRALARPCRGLRITGRRWWPPCWLLPLSSGASTARG